MRTTDRYTFILTAVRNEETQFSRQVHPQHSGLSLQWAKKDNAYFTPTISGNLKFVGDDFTAIHSQSVKTQFILSILEKGITLAQLTFRKTDCTTDLNHRILEVKPNIKNPYSKLTDKLDEEYNLLHLGIDKKSLNCRLFPAMNTYFADDTETHLFRLEDYSTLSVQQQETSYWRLTQGKTYDNSFWQGMHFSGYPVISLLFIDHKTETKYLFKFSVFDFADSTDTESYTYNIGQTAMAGTIKYITVTGIGSTNQFKIGLPSHVIGDDRYIIDGTSIFIRSNLTYGQGIGMKRIETTYGQLHNNLTQVRMEFDSGLGTITYGLDIYSFIYYYGYVTHKVYEDRLINSNKYIRDILGDDINFKSRGAYTESESGVAQMKTYVSFSTNKSTTNNGYKKIQDEDAYYAPPNTEDKWIPVKQDNWVSGISFWQKPLYINRSLFSQEVADTPINDFYSLGDAIKAVVSKIDDRVVFEPDEAHSKFLFASKNPVSREKQGLLYITQKSNILKLGYDYPAWLAPITLGKIFTLLKNAFNCRWDIYRDENTGLYHLRIEHLLFYMNGGSYSSSQRTTLDLTSIHDTANHLPISFNTSHWNYQSGSGGTSQATSYEYGWMDTQSKLFDGEKITIPQDLQIFEKESVEERKVDRFDSDIDFCIGVPSQISSDGFAIVMESTSNAGYVWRDRYTDKYIGQNYILSFTYLQKNFGLYGLYSDSVSIGEDTLYLVPRVGRLRTSDIRFRVPKGTEVKPEMNIKTEVGEGEISNLKLDFTSDTYEATVLYQTEN